MDPLTESMSPMIGLTLEMFALPAGQRVTIEFTTPAQRAWTLGGEDLVTGFTIAPLDSGVTLRDLQLRANVLTFVPVDSVPSIRFDMHVDISGHIIGGTQDVRENGYIRYSTKQDYIRVLGYSSWYLKLV